MSEKDNLELEKQKLEVERQKLDLERQKLEFERDKVSPNKNLDKTLIKGGTLNILGLISSIILLISVFLPWVESRSSGFGFSSSASINGMSTANGVLVLLCSIAAIILVFIRNKFTFIPGVISFLLGLSVVLGVGSFSLSGGGASVRAGFAIGPIVTILSSIVLVLSATVKINNKSSGIDLSVISDFYKKYKFYILLPIAILCSLYILNIKYFWFRFNLDFLFHFVIIGLPALIFYKLKLNRSLKIYVASLVTLSILTFFLPDRYESSGAILINYLDAYFNAFTLFTIPFYLLMIIAIVTDLLEIYKSEYLAMITPRWRILFKPLLPVLFLLVPLILSFFYYSITRTIITKEDKEKFVQENSYFSGDWYFLNNSNTKVLQLEISEPRDVTVKEKYSDSLNASISMRLNEADNNNVQSLYESIDFSLGYSNKIFFPLRFEKHIEILSMDDDVLNIKLTYDGGETQKTKAYRKSERLYEVIQNKKAELLKQKQDELYKTENILIAKFSYVEFGDFFHLIFEDVNGKEWDFGSGENNLGSFDFGEEESNPDLVGKNFKIKWKIKKVKSYDMTGENIIEIDAPSIINIELNN